MSAQFLGVHRNSQGKRVYKKFNTQAEAKHFARTGEVKSKR